MKGITRYPIYALLATGLLLAALLVLTPHPISRADPRVLYAAPDGATSGNCNSWANACTLQYALSLAQSGDEIWVKKGIHYPGPASDRTATFALKNGVALYGGFAGTESSRDARNWQANPTVLSRAYQCSNKCPARPGLGLGVRRLPCVHQEHNGSLADG